MHGYNHLYNTTLFGDDHQLDNTLLIGLILELVRRSDFPDKPSRYRSLFACQEISEVKQFRELLANERGDDGIRTAPIYEVWNEAPVHRGDMRLLDSDGPILDIYRRANLYWSGKSISHTNGEEPFWEILIPLPASTGRRVTE